MGRHVEPRTGTDAEVEAETARIGNRALDLIGIIYCSADTAEAAALSDAADWQPGEDQVITMTAMLCKRIAEIAERDRTTLADAARSLLAARDRIEERGA